MESATQTVSIGITGHRNLGPDQLNVLEPVVLRAIQNILYYHESTHQVTPQPEFISPIAYGADTLFANIALKNFAGPLRIYIPFEQEEYIKDFTKPEQKAEFELLLANPRVKELRLVGHFSSGNRDSFYLEAGKKIVDDSDYMIAIWDEKKANGVGGTGDIVDYAVSLDKDLLVINPYDTEIKIKGNYLPCLKECPDGQPRPDQLSDDIIRDYYFLYDSFAIRNQVIYNKLWRYCFSLGWMAAFILSLKVAFTLPENIQFVLTLLEIFLFVRIGLKIWSEKRHAFHKKYLQYRFIAERLRINNLTHNCGYYPIKSETKVIHKALQEIESKYPVDLLNKVIRLTAYSAGGIERKKELVKAFAASQSSYHKRRAGLLEKSNNGNALMKKACILTFAGVVLFHAATEFDANSFLNLIKDHTLEFEPKKTSRFYLSEISFLLYLFIPATLARFEAVKFLNDWERLITQSTYMHEFFDGVLTKIDKIDNDKALYNLLTELNENMYLENLDWEMFMVNKNEIID